MGNSTSKSSNNNSNCNPSNKLHGSSKGGVTQFVKNSTYESSSVYGKDGVFNISRIRKNIHPPDRFKDVPIQSGTLYLCMKEMNFTSFNTGTAHYSLVLDAGGLSDTEYIRGIQMHIAFTSEEKQIIYLQHPIEIFRTDFCSVRDTGSIVYPNDSIENLKMIYNNHPQYSDVDLNGLNKSQLWYYYIVFQVDEWLSEFTQANGKKFSPKCNCQSFSRFLHQKLSGVFFPDVKVFGQTSFEKLAFGMYSMVKN